MSIQMSINGFFQNLSEVERKNAPERLFYEGDESLLFQGSKVSVVGSRKATKEGEFRAKVLTRALVEHGITVVSGLAEGIDTVAHMTAMDLGGKTIAVLGTPLDKVFPAKNKQLLVDIKKGHLAISQFPEGHPTFPKNFPMRNKTMALISDATVIVEASENSGTRHQGWEALRLGRVVMIMRNVAEDKSLSWPREMIKYGAQVLTRENMEDLISDIPIFSTGVEYAF